MSVVTVTPQDFLRALWGAGPGVAELTTIVPKGPVRSFPFTYPASLDSFVDAARRHNKDANVYMGVCLRREPWPRKNARGHEEKRGTEENALSAGALWVEIDFAGLGHKGKTVDADVARRKLAEFSHKPSIVVKSGGGIHVYWLLAEPVTGIFLPNVKAASASLAEHFGADNVSDLARILRLPSLTNIKYDPPRPVEISYWHPEHRYTLSDFGYGTVSIPVENPTNPTTSSTPPPPSFPESSAPTASRPMPSIDLPEDVAKKIGQMFAEIWSPGLRHRMSLDVSGMLVHAGVSLSSTKLVVSTASETVGGDTISRLKAVEDTYTRFAYGHEIAGATVLEKMIDEDFPPLSRDKAKKIVASIRKLLPKRVATDGEKGTPDFVVTRVVKFDSRPARYQVFIEKDGEQHEVTCETPVFDEFKLFRRAFFEATANKRIHIKGPGKIRQPVWEQLTENAPLDVKSAPREASVAGSIESELEEFLDGKKENPEYGTLRSFAGYSEQDVFFRLAAFKHHLKDKSVKATDPEITHVLRISGWTDEQRRMGEKNPRLWIKQLNGHTPLQKPDLFQNLNSPSTTRTRESSSNEKK